MIEPAQIVGAGIIGLIFVPIVSMVFVVTGPPPLRRLAGTVLGFACLVQTLLVLLCIWAGLSKPSTGIGNGVFFILAMPLAIFAMVCGAFWRGARAASRMG